MARTVLTTGANSGIGLATVLELARRGFRSVGSVRSEEKARVVAQAAARSGVEVETVLLDVVDAEECARVIDGLRPYGLVNNAGYPAVGAMEDVADDEARGALETMAVAPMRLARLAIPHMRARGEGRIVNLSSVYGRTTTPLAGWYHSTAPDGREPSDGEPGPPRSPTVAVLRRAGRPRAPRSARSTARRPRRDGGSARR